jgi:hypothetical protein
MHACIHSRLFRHDRGRGRRLDSFSRVIEFSNSIEEFHTSRRQRLALWYELGSLVLVDRHYRFADNGRP